MLLFCSDSSARNILYICDKRNLRQLLHTYFRSYFRAFIGTKFNSFQNVTKKLYYILLSICHC